MEKVIFIWDMFKKNKIFFFLLLFILVSLSGVFCVRKVSAVEINYDCFKDIAGNARGVCQENGCNPESDYIEITGSQNDCPSGSNLSCCVKRECTLRNGVCSNSRPAGYSSKKYNVTECTIDVEGNTLMNRFCFLPIPEEEKCKDGIGGDPNSKVGCTKGVDSKDCEKSFGESSILISGNPQLNCIDENGEGYICCLKPNNSSSSSSNSSSSSSNSSSLSSSSSSSNFSSSGCSDSPSEGIKGGFLFFKGSIVPCGRSCDDPNTEVNETETCTLCHFIIMFFNIFELLVSLLIIVALLFITISGVVFLVSVGNPNLRTTAKNILTKTLTGFGIALLSWLIIFTLLKFISAKSDMLGNGEKWNEFKCEMDSVFDKESSNSELWSPESAGSDSDHIPGGAGGGF